MLYKIINTYADESDFILNLIDDHPYIGYIVVLCMLYTVHIRLLCTMSNILSGQNGMIRKNHCLYWEYL